MTTLTGSRCGTYTPTAMHAPNPPCDVVTRRETRGPSGSTSRAVLAVALLGLATLSAAVGCTRSTGPGHHPLVVIGVDGATWDVIDPLVAAGELPALASLIQRGARSDLVTLPPMVSPLAWTTYATGLFPREHNILDYTYPYVGEARHPVEASARRAPAIWNVAGHYGETVAIIAPYASSPVEPVAGVMVSDALLEHRGGRTFPPELSHSLDLLPPPAAGSSLLDAFFGWPYDPADGDDPASPYASATRVVRRNLDDGAVRDENARRALLHVAAEPHDLTFVYLRAVDFACHETWWFWDDKDFDRSPPPREQELLHGAIPAAYRLADRVVADVLARFGPRANIVVVSDHGFGSAAGFRLWEFVEGSPPSPEDLSGMHRFNGVLLAAGPDIAPGTYPGIDMMSVTPLLLRLLDLPISSELPGMTPEQLLTPRFRERHPQRQVDSYQIGWSPPASSEAVTEEEDTQGMKQLEALGYIEPGVPVGGRQRAQDVDFWHIRPRLRMYALLTEISFWMLHGDREHLTALLSEISERDPDLFARLPDVVEKVTRAMEADFPEPIFPAGAMTDFERVYQSCRAARP